MPDTGDDKVKFARAGARRLIEQVPTAFAGLAALCGVAYLAGSIYTRAYFSELGASWVLEEVPAAVYFSQSWVPLLLMLYLGYLATTNLARVGRQDDRMTNEPLRVSTAIVRYGVWGLLALLVLLPLCSSVGYIVPAIVLAILTVVLLLIVLGAALELVTVRFRTANRSPELSMAYLSFVVVAAALYMAPAQLGSNWARVDQQPTSSLLPVYVRSEGDREYRLLLSVGERLYIFPSKFEGRHPPVHAIVMADVSFTPPQQSGE